MPSSTTPPSADILKANPEIGGVILLEPFTDEFYGIAVSKNRQDVLKAINEGLAAIRASGEYDQIYNAWLGVPATAEGDSGAAMAEDVVWVGELRRVRWDRAKVVAVDDMTVEFDLCKPDPAFLSKVAFSAFGIPAQRMDQKPAAPATCWITRSAPAPTCWTAGTAATASSSRRTPITGASRPRPTPSCSAG